MLGLILGDIVGSRFELDNTLRLDFDFFTQQSVFTDDTVLACAIAQALLEDRDYVECLRGLCSKYPDAGYGGRFKEWLRGGDPRPYHSWGNGAAVRAMPIGYKMQSEQDVIDAATRSAICTHNHPDGIAGAQAMALAVYWLRIGADAQELQERLSETFGYCFEKSMEDYREDGDFSVHCKDTIPPAVLAFSQADSVEQALRFAVFAGGDSDTIAAMAGGLAQAGGLGMGKNSVDEVMKRITPELRGILESFNEAFGLRTSATENE